MRGLVVLWVLAAVAGDAQAFASTGTRHAFLRRGHKRCCSPRVIMSFEPERVKALSMDVTGTILVTRHPIAETYADAAVWARLSDPPSAQEMNIAFKEAYSRHNMESPCFGAVEGVSGRRWWKRTVKSALDICGCQYSETEFQRYFRRVYQHFGSPYGYEGLSDALAFLDWVRAV